VLRRSTLSGAIPWLLAAALIALSVHFGRQLQVDRPEVFLGAAPLVGQDPRDGWDWRFGWPLVAAGVVAAVLVWCVGSGRWSRWSMRIVSLVTAASAGAFALLLALTDGRIGLLRGADHETEYLANLPITPPAREFVRDFVADIQQYSVHVRGHPPGFVLVLKFLDAIGLTGAWPVVALSVFATVAVPLAVLCAVRTVADDDWARRVAPLLAVSPYALWMMTSADAVFSAVGAWSVATCVLAVLADGRRAVVWGLVSGLLLGALLFMTYGGATFSIALLVPTAVALRSRGRAVVPALGAVVVAVVVVTVVFAAFGFWWLDGARETQRQYWAGTAQFRPFGYFMIANLAVALIAIGPVGFAGLVDLARRWRRPPAVWPLVVGGLLALAASHLSQYTRAEVERIWLLFYPWLLVAAGTPVLHIPARRAAAAVAVQAGCSIALQAALVSKW
jgi:methylthioxylose transferase